MNSIVLSPLGSGAIYSFVCLLIGLIFLIVFIFRKPMPSNAKYISLGIILPLMGLFLFTLYQSFTSSLSWDDKQFSINVPLYSQTLPTSAILFSEARAIDLATEPELAPKWRTNGLGLPGYSLGWFKLNNGSKAILSLTDSEQVMLLPTTKGFVMVMSVDDVSSALLKLHAETQ